MTIPTSIDINAALVVTSLLEVPLLRDVPALSSLGAADGHSEDAGYAVGEEGEGFNDGEVGTTEGVQVGYIEG